MYVCINMYRYRYIHTNIYIHIYVCVCVRACACACVCNISQCLYLVDTSQKNELCLFKIEENNETIEFSY